jgi:hypothetical protein
MYTVTVFSRHNKEAVDTRNFEYGTWTDIGYWLDYAGYIHSDYKVEVRFS